MSISRSVAAAEAEHGLVASLAAPPSMRAGSGLAGEGAPDATDKSGSARCEIPAEGVTD